MSQLEEALIFQIAAAGLPKPERELRFAKEAWGRQYRFDLSWPEIKLALEVQGGTWGQGSRRGRHSRGAGQAEDYRKLNLAVFMGWRVLYVTTEMIEGAEALDIIEAFFKGGNRWPVRAERKVTKKEPRSRAAGSR